MHLRANEHWAQTSSDSLKTGAVQEFRYQNKEYIGYLIDSSVLSVAALKELQQKLHSKISEYCPELPSHAIQPEIFPQIYIA